MKRALANLPKRFGLMGPVLLEPECLDLGWVEPYARNRVDPSLGKRPPRPLDFQCRDVRHAEERREPVESLAPGMATMQSATLRCERNTVLSIDGIHGAFTPDYVQEPDNLPGHRRRS